MLLNVATKIVYNTIFICNTMKEQIIKAIKFVIEAVHGGVIK